MESTKTKSSSSAGPSAHNEPIPARLNPPNNSSNTQPGPNQSDPNTQPGPNQGPFGFASQLGSNLFYFSYQIIPTTHCRPEPDDPLYFYYLPFDGPELVSVKQVLTESENYAT